MRAAPAVAAVLLTLLGGCQSFAYKHAARALQTAPPPMDHGLDAQVLPSGLRLAVFQVPGQRDVTVWLSLGGGASDEAAGRPGVASVALRAALVAPRGRGAASLLERLYAAGALWDATALADESAVSVRCRATALPSVVEALSDLLDDPAAGVDESTVAAAKEELAVSLERGRASEATLFAEVIRLGLRDTPFARDASTPALARSISLAEVRAHLLASFTPAQAILTVSTGQEAEGMGIRVAAGLRGRAAGDPASAVAPAATYSSTPPPAHLETTAVALVGGEKPRLVLAWRAPGLRFAPAARLAAVAVREVLADRAARPDLASKVGQVTSTFLALDRAGLLLVDVPLERLEDAAEVRQDLLREVKKAARLWSSRGPSVAAAWRQELRLERERDLAQGWVGPVGRLARATGSTDLPSWFDLNDQSQVGPAVTGWLQAWVEPGPAVVATVAASPTSAGTGADTSGAGAQAGQPGGQVTWPVAHSLVAAAAPGPGAIAPLLEPAGFTDARRVTLHNGLEVVVLRRPGAPLAVLRLVLPAGSRRPSEWKAAQRALEAAHRHLHQQGFVLAPAAESYTDGVLIEASGPNSWVPAIVEAVACWGLRHSTPGLREPAKDDDLTSRATEAALTGGGLPWPSGGQAWTQEFLGRVGLADEAVAVLVGDVDPEQALEHLRIAFRRFERAGVYQQAGLSTPAWPKARRVLVRDLPGAPQASLFLLLRLPDRLADETEEAPVLEKLLSDRARRTFGSSGLEVGSSRWRAGQASFLMLSLEGPAALVPPAAGELLRELGRLAERGPSGVDAGLARWDRARDLAYAFDSPFGAAAGLQQLVTSGAPLDRWDTVASRLRPLDAEALHLFLGTAAIGAEALLLTGDLAVLGPLLQREGLTPEVVAPQAHAQAPAAGVKK